MEGSGGGGEGRRVLYARTHMKLNNIFELIEFVETLAVNSFFFK